jgi:tRNA(fMet)-specific endonuclease VapC
LRRAVTEEAAITVSSLVLFELWYGVARSGRRGENAERLRAFLSSNIGIVPFEESDASIAGDPRARLEASGTMIGPYDLLIVAQALRTRTAIVTANTSEFARVPSLVWQDWSVEASSRRPARKPGPEADCSAARWLAGAR